MWSRLAAGGVEDGLDATVLVLGEELGGTRADLGQGAGGCQHALAHLGVVREDLLDEVRAEVVLAVLGEPDEDADEPRTVVGADRLCRELLDGDLVPVPEAEDLLDLLAVLRPRHDGEVGDEELGDVRPRLRVHAGHLLAGAVPERLDHLEEEGAVLGTLHPATVAVVDVHSRLGRRDGNMGQTACAVERVALLRVIFHSVFSCSRCPVNVLAFLGPCLGHNNSRKPGFCQ